MNRITRIAAIALSLAAAGSAFADDITIDPVQHQSLKTRAQVQAELAQFQAAGVNPWSMGYSMGSNFKPQLTRADVIAELKAAQASGELQGLASEDSGAAYFARVRTQAARANVIAAR
ncbi:MAG: DUF4148 domain-containing protein [Rubrivivax sp.]